MASIQRDIHIAASANSLWSALRDVGALHTRLVPGFVTHCEMDGDAARQVRFANGAQVREVIVTVDEAARRIVWSAAGGRLTHHNASAQVVDEGGSHCRVIWIADLLPNDIAGNVAAMMEQGIGVIKTTLERSP